MTKFKLTRQELSEMIQRSVKKVLKEDWYDGSSDAQQDDAQQSYYNRRHGDDYGEEESEFNGDFPEQDDYSKFESKKPKTIKVKLSELRDVIKSIVIENYDNDTRTQDMVNDESGMYEEAEPSVGLSKTQKSNVVKKS